MKITPDHVGKWVYLRNKDVAQIVEWNHNAPYYPVQVLYKGRLASYMTNGAYIDEHEEHDLDIISFHRNGGGECSAERCPQLFRGVHSDSCSLYKPEYGDERDDPKFGWAVKRQRKPWEAIDDNV